VTGGITDSLATAPMRCKLIDWVNNGMRNGPVGRDARRRIIGDRVGT
jgi:hypothetical protein